MQTRTFKKTLSLVLIFSLAFTIMNIGGFIPQAEATTYTYSSTYIPVGTHTVATRYMTGGDTVKFNMTYTPPNMTVNYGIVSPSGSFTYVTSLSGSMTLSFTAQQAGQHSIRIMNNGSSPIYVSGTCTYSDNRVYRSARIRYDASYGPSNSAVISGLTAQFNSATSGFESTFGIVFSLNGDVEQTTALNGSTCRLADNLFCNADNGTACGVDANCNTNHIKSAARLIGLLPSPSINTIRVVGHAICWYDTRTSPYEHFGTTVTGSGLGGLGSLRGRDTIVTSRAASTLPTLIQHQLSHNLGATDCTNPCAVNANYFILDKWCTTCTNSILSNK